MRTTKGICVKCGSAGNAGLNMCKIRETVRVILHTVNSDALTMNGVLGITV